MKSTDRARLTAALREHVAAIAGELRAQMRAPGGERVRALQLHKDEAVGDDFDVWTDLLSRRAAVLWVLKSVYVRVLEDRGLLAPGRLLDPEAQQLFEKLAPNLGETAFLRWVYKDLASPNGGLPELFSVQPAELVLPSDARSRALIAFWRHRDADSGVQWSFAEERFEGELMGDLYQELDPVVKDRFALCQTPDFVREFILDRTLTPAIETFGADKVRLLDPACGSGHFLIDGLKRLVAATAVQHKSWSRAKVLEHALGRVVGMDLNDYACALARARLVMTAAELAGVNTLAEAAKFHPHVYWADGLEQVERDEVKPSLQFGLFETVEEKPRATLTRADVRAALRKVFAEKFHAVVANPPYMTERDPKKKEYHRQKTRSTQRYLSAYKEYSLCSPFVERAFHMAADGGFVGMVLANNFTTRDFGRPLVDLVLSNVDLTLIADTSGAILAESGFETPTVLLFARSQRPTQSTVRVVLSKKGDTARSADCSKGPTWSSLVAGAAIPGFENDYIRVADLPRSTLAKHPWNLSGGGAASLKETLEGLAPTKLRDLVAEIGFGCMTRADEIYFTPRDVLRRAGISDEHIVFTVEGERVRDWAISDPSTAIFPYNSSLSPVLEAEAPAVHRFLWPYRSLLWLRREPNGNHHEIGLTWWEWSRFQRNRYRAPLSIAYSFVATHNHFVFDRGGKVFNRTAPIIKLAPGSSENDHFYILGVLNSSALGLWFRNKLHKVGGRSSGTKRQSEIWAQRREFAVGLVEQAPIPTQQRDRITALARKIDALGNALSAVQPSATLTAPWQHQTLAQVLTESESRSKLIRKEMVAFQEELDWTVYVAFGFAAQDVLCPLDDVEPLASEHRPFAVHLARAASAGAATYWFDAMAVTPSTEFPEFTRRTTRPLFERRLELLGSNGPISLFEAPENKRKWEPLTFRTDLSEVEFTWLAECVESAAKSRGRPVSLQHLAAAVQDDPRFMAVASLYQNRRDVDVLGLVDEILTSESVPSHSFHIYTPSGYAKRAAWEQVWVLQRKEDAGEKIVSMPELPEFSYGSRGKSVDYLRAEFWRIRGKLDVPRERFIAFTEVPGRSGAETLYGWAGWTPLQRLKALLAIDADLEDAGILPADRTGVLDSAWRLLPDVAREDPPAAARLKAELQALVGPTGPSPESLEDWRKRFPPPKPPKKKTERARKAPKADEEDDT